MVAVEHQGWPAALALERTDHVGTAILDLLPADSQPDGLECFADPLSDGLLGASRARGAHVGARGIDEPLLVDTADQPVAQFGVDGRTHRWK